jgi:hypothetical protein
MLRGSYVHTVPVDFLSTSYQVLVLYNTFVEYRSTGVVRMIQYSKLKVLEYDRVYKSTSSLRLLYIVRSNSRDEYYSTKDCTVYHTGLLVPGIRCDAIEHF